jgi:hypothetical protein
LGKGVDVNTRAMLSSKAEWKDDNHREDGFGQGEFFPSTTNRMLTEELL